MRKTFEIVESIRNINNILESEDINWLELLPEGDIPSPDEQAAEFHLELVRKFEQRDYVYRHLLMREQELKQTINDLQSRLRTIRKNMENLKEQSKYYMLQLQEIDPEGYESIELKNTRYKISKTNTKKLDVFGDEQDICQFMLNNNELQDFVRMKLSVDKKALKEFIENTGVEVPGVQLLDGEPRLLGLPTIKSITDDSNS